MGGDRMSKVIFNEGMSERKKPWMRQNNKWMQKWNISLNACPTNSKELKNFVLEKFRKGKGIMFKNSTPLVISNKKSTLELSFCGEQKFLLLN